MRNIAIILSLLAITASSCGQANKKQTSEAREEKVDTIPFSIADWGFIEFNNDVFYHKYKQSWSDTVTTEKDYQKNILLLFERSSPKDTRYGFQHFIYTKDTDYWSAIYLIDSISMDNGMYSLLFSYWNWNCPLEVSPETKCMDKCMDAQAWLVNYSSDNKYIDSRMIYRDGKVDGREFNIYSKLYLDDKKFITIDGEMFTDSGIPVVIREDGTFEEFPDIPFSATNIAVSNCHANGLYGKFPLKQKWTLVSLNDNKITTVETKKNYYDWVENISTLFVNRWEDYIPFDIAFKGIYTENDIEILPLIAENEAEIETEIINLIKQNLPDKEYFQQAEVEKIQLYLFPNEDNPFWIAYYTFQRKDYENSSDYTSLIGVTANEKVVLLADYCVYENSAYILRLKNDFYLYVENTSCGEGALGQSHLYKLTTDFEKVFEDTIVCD